MNSAKTHKKIMLVCLGNICRSPLAKAIFLEILNKNHQTRNFFVDASGTSAYHIGEEPDPRMSETAARHGIKMNHRGKQLTYQDLQDFDLIFAMDKQNYQDIQTLSPNNPLLRKVYLFRKFDPQAQPGESVPDPYYGGSQGFENVFQIVSRSCQNIFEKLLSREI